jgi:aminopeptidase N
MFFWVTCNKMTQKNRAYPRLIKLSSILLLLLFYLVPRQYTARIPIHYDDRIYPHIHSVQTYLIHLDVDLNNSIYHGDQVVSILGMDLRQIVLDSSNLVVHLARIDNCAVHVSYKKNKLILSLNKTISGLFDLHLKFTGTINNQKVGFFRFVDQNGKMAYATQFQTNNARMSFPCFDKPHYKSIFRIRITHPMNYKALSNSPVLSVSTSNLISTTTFHDTILLSTYLVAWVLHPNYNFTTLKTKQGLSVNVYSLANCNFAAFISVFSANYLQELLKLPLPLSKVDLFPIASFPCTWF